ncbi:DUF3265 domain-containing protein [Vibrio splendidus]|nr:DUF3265 domain-containing protein [Vibrio splendidus]
MLALCHQFRRQLTNCLRVTANLWHFWFGRVLGLRWLCLGIVVVSHT